MRHHFERLQRPSPVLLHFADTRDAETATNISATFSTAGHYSGPIPVVGESRTVTATNRTFSETFAQGSTVHIYGPTRTNETLPGRAAGTPPSGSPRLAAPRHTRQPELALAPRTTSGDNLDSAIRTADPAAPAHPRRTPCRDQRLT